MVLVEVEDSESNVNVVQIPLDGTILNRNTDYVISMIKSLKKTNGYCPCVPKYNWNEDTRCQCKTYRETLECACSLYVKE